jgi:hypothetical protein
MGPARGQVIRSLDLFLVHHRHKKFGIEKQKRPVETHGRNTDDGVGMLIYKTRAAQHTWIILKAVVPA